MKTLEILLASIIPDEMLVHKLDEEIQQYKLDPSSDNMASLCATAAMLLTKHISGGTPQGAIKMAEEFEKRQRIDRLFDVDKTN